MDIFKYDSPLMSFLNTVFDLMFLNILCFICCIPIITIGPALAAKYDVAMRIVRKEEPTIFQAVDHYLECTACCLFSLIY